MSVTIYTTNSCPYCSMAKDFMKRKGVKFQEKNVEKDAKAANEMVMKSGQMAVPVIDINGRIIVGFDRYGIERALEKAEIIE